MFSQKLFELQRLGLLRTICDRTPSTGSRIVVEGKELISFASNDYLGLASHPDITAAAKRAIDEFGFGSGASRLLAGGSVLHRKLEETIARFKGTETALVFNSGYAANTGIIPSLTGEGDVIFSDELNHASIIDGCRLSRARTVVYGHKDTAHLDELLRKEFLAVGSGKGNLLVATDTVFSMDGDIAPLGEIYGLCGKYDALLYIDDAHGTGVIGGGRGALAHFNLLPEPRIIQMGTFSKALGSYGAFAAGSRDVIDWIANRARSFIFSTALPACAVAASLKAVELVEGMPALVGKLRENRSILAEALVKAGFDTGESETPIIPLLVKNNEEALAASGYLRGKGIYAPAIRPPTVKAPRLRIAIKASHSEEDLNALVRALTAFPFSKNSSS